METKTEPPAESPTSVLEEEDLCVEIDVKLVKAEEELLEARVMDEETKEMEKEEEAPVLNETQFSKLDELLTKTQLYTDFLLDDIAFEVSEKPSELEPVPVQKTRGQKRKATTYNNAKAKRAVAAMLTRSKDGETIEDVNLTEEERVDKQKKELVPLLTGGKLKSYQLKGVKWLISLWQNGLNGILADQMGLGKTIQTIGFLSHLKSNGLDGPYLVIAPLSTLSNWISEVSRFTPSMKAIIYHGNKQERKEIRSMHMPKSFFPNFPIVVTSYEVALADARRYLKHYNWKYLVVDEGHRLKNSKCKLVQELKHIPVENKILLTGTPLQNNLSELWSLLNFLPNIFSSHEEFESWFDLEGKCHNEAMKEELEEKRRAQVLPKLHAILRPFLLRRIKIDVELTLPRKKEIIIYSTMTEHQKKFQEHLVNKTLEQHLILEKATRVSGMRGKLNNLMIQLRKNCNHPDLLESAFDGSDFYPPVDQIVEQCGKFSLLERLLKQLLAGKHKVLIFTQWTKILDLMDYYFSEKGFEVCRIDGSVKLDDRRQQIASFNDVASTCRIFLLSTRAGGLGINLTAADTCILYDSDWNPQIDLQAMDRCHRIGQTKPVHVYRLATAQSVEGQMLKRAFSKLKLEHVVIGKGKFHQERAKPETDVFEKKIHSEFMVDQDELKGTTAVAFFNRDKINVVVDSRESNEGTPIGDRKANWKAKVHNSAKKWYKISVNIVAVMVGQRTPCAVLKPIFMSWATALENKGKSIIVSEASSFVENYLNVLSKKQDRDYKFGLIIAGYDTLKDMQIFKVYILGSVVRNESIDTSQMYTAFGSGSKYVIDYFNHHKYDRNCSTDQAKDFATKAVFSASFYDKGTDGNLHYFEVNKKQWHEVSYTEALSTYSSYYSEYDEVRILLLVYRDDEGAIAADKLIDMFWPEVNIQTAHVVDHRFTPEKNQFYFHRLIFSSEAEVEKALKKTIIVGSTYMGSTILSRFGYKTKCTNRPVFLQKASKKLVDHILDHSTMMLTWPP